MLGWTVPGDSEGRSCHTPLKPLRAHHVANAGVGQASAGQKQSLGSTCSCGAKAGSSDWVVSMNRVPCTTLASMAHAVNSTCCTSQTEVRQSRMVIGSATKRPVELPLRFFDGHVIDTCIATPHEPIGLEFPVLVSIRAEPISRVIVPLIGVTNCDPIAFMQPQLFDESVVKLLVPLPLKKRLSLSSAIGEFRSIAPLRIRCICQRDLGRIARVPAVLRQTDFLFGSLEREWWQGRASFHDMTSLKTCRTICLQAQC